MHILQKWIESPQDFVEGIKLFEYFNGSETWLKMFNQLGESTYTRVELYRQINKVLGQIEDKNRPEEKIIDYKKIEKVKPQGILNIDEKRKESYKQANRVHYVLQLSVEDIISGKKPLANQREVIFELRNLFEEIDLAWRITDEFDESGKILTFEKHESYTKITDVNHAANRRRTLVTYLAPSYLAAKPDKGKEDFIKKTKLEIDYLDKIMIENAAPIQL